VGLDVVFTEPFFLFLFMPLSLVAILLTRGWGHSISILLFSLVFYYWDVGWAVFILVGSILFNWYVGLWLERSRKRWILIFGILANVAVLAFFKYALFGAGILDRLASLDTSKHFQYIILPAGISFFTFESISYLMDVWRKDTPAEKRLIVFGAWQSFYPHLIAGPIVRFRDVIQDFHKPKPSLDSAAAGAARFGHGLLKKLLVADTVGLVADACFAVPAAELNPATAWLGAIAYALQIYFDFSAYSDMAIGIAMMCGIRLMENFQHPYSSSTITEFWRRWHISLSTWFRDYLYIPLGGNRLGTMKTYRNLLIVFFVTGLWHGAAWTFIIWGLYHGGFLVLERLVLKGKANTITNWIPRFIYVLPVVIIGWVLFRAGSMTHAAQYLIAMFDPARLGAAMPASVEQVVTPWVVIVMVLGSLIFFAPRGPTIGVLTGASGGWMRELAKTGYIAACLLIAGVLALSSDFSPFLYFRF
jgi:alginate O-acetyltransferase complex protein AlgI